MLSAEFKVQNLKFKVQRAETGIGKRRRFARGSVALEVLAVLEALAVLSAAD